jgi:hypothetical protein
MKSGFTPSAFFAAVSLTALLAPFSIHARDLLVDQRGGTPYSSLAAAASAATAGDTIILAKGSGPYRESLTLTTSGTASAPITIEGNGETITGFAPLVFTQSGGVWIYTLPNPFATAPVVIASQGRRILQDQATGNFIGPVFLRADGKTLELTAGTSPLGWEISARSSVVSLNNVSNHTYRNLIATGGTNDGFNLHGAGTNLVFENIAAHSNLDEGFSAHETINCTINGGRFWANDNGIANINDSVMTASNIKVHDNLGWGLWLADNTQSTLTNVRAWNNGVVQIRFDANAAGTATQVSSWTPSWSTPPWRRYNESKNVTTSGSLGGNATYTPVPFWTGAPVTVTSPSAPVAINPTSTTAVPSVTALITGAVSAGRPLVVLPAGIHPLTSQINVTNANNLEIDGTGATLLMTIRKRITLYVSGGNNLVIRGLTLDYDPLPFTQATVTGVTSSVINFTVHDGYPDVATDFGSTPPTHLFKPDGNRHPDAFDFYKPTLAVLTPRTGTLTKTGPNWPATLAVGDLLVLDRREADATNAVEIRNNLGPVTFEDFTLLSSPTLGFAGRYGQGLVTFRRVALRAGPIPAGATQPRLFSTNADALNFVQCRQGPLIENCDISRQGDDSLNVHGYFFKITTVLSPTSFQFTNPGTSGFLSPVLAGDTARFHAAGNFNVVSNGAIASTSVVGSTGGITTYQINLSVAPSTPVAVNQWFDIPQVNCPGFIVRDSYFHDHRGRGLRIMANNGIVERNRFERLTKAAVSIGPELGQWREAGYVDNVTVRDNEIRNIGVDLSLSANGIPTQGAISVFLHSDNNTAPYYAGNSNITLEDNLIEETSVSGIHAYAVTGLIVRGNVLRHTNLVRGPGTDPTNGLVTTGPISVSAATSPTVTDNSSLVLEDFETYASGASFTTGQSLGAAGDGWAYAWRTASSFTTTTGTIAATSPLDDGQRLGVSVTTQSGKTSSNGAVGRGYMVPVTTSPYDYAFRFRADTLPSNIRYVLCENRIRAAGPDGSTTWQVANIGGTWQAFNGSANGGPNTYVDTGLSASPGTAYDFAVTIDPATRKWAVTISNGTSGVTLSNLNFRTTTFTTDTTEAIGGRWLTFSTQEVLAGSTTVGATGTFSLDGIAVHTALP